MPRPRLTFACELSSERLDDLFADRPVIAGLRALNSRVALPLTAFTPESAEVVHRFNDEGVPVLAIPLLSFDEGYYFTADNFLRAAERYQEWKAWTQEQRLVWDAVGLDTEPDIRLFQQVAGNPWGLVPMLFASYLPAGSPAAGCGGLRRAGIYTVQISVITWTVQVLASARVPPAGASCACR